MNKADDFEEAWAIMENQLESGAIINKERKKQMSNKNANIGAKTRPSAKLWLAYIKMWLVSAFALLVCWSNGIGGRYRTYF